MTPSADAPDGGFWFIGPKSATTDTWVSLQNEDDLLGEALTEAVRNGSAPTSPVPLRVNNRGKHVGDLLWTTGSFIVVASQRFIDTLVSLEATGWVSVPALVTYANGNELPGYQLLVVTGKCADFTGNPDRDDDDDTEYPVDASQGWDGSDVFWEESGPAFWRFIATERVRQGLVEANLGRLEIERPYT